jgi:hypothetical protein
MFAWACPFCMCARECVCARVVCILAFILSVYVCGTHFHDHPGTVCATCPLSLAPGIEARFLASIRTSHGHARLIQIPSFPEPKTVHRIFPCTCSKCCTNLLRNDHRHDESSLCISCKCAFSHVYFSTMGAESSICCGLPHAQTRTSLLHVCSSIVVRSSIWENMVTKYGVHNCADVSSMQNTSFWCAYIMYKHTYIHTYSMNAHTHTYSHAQTHTHIHARIQVYFDLVVVKPHCGEDGQPDRFHFEVETNGSLDPVSHLCLCVCKRSVFVCTYIVVKMGSLIASKLGGYDKWLLGPGKPLVFVCMQALCVCVYMLLPF